MTMDYLSIEEAKKKRAAKEQRDRLRQDHVAACLDKQALAYLAEYFGCNEPAFVESDGYNKEAAMRRDSFRAFYLTLRRWRKRWETKNR